jgi:hypothetical protein
MSTFVKGGAARTPFGRNEYLRSTNPAPTVESYTVAKNSVPVSTIDGSIQRMLQPGTVMAKITSGPDSGKVGPYCATSGTKEVQTLTATAITAGTFTLSFGGQTTAPIAWNATAAVIAAALNLLDTIQYVGGVVGTGGPINTTPVVLTFQLGGDVALVTVNTAGLTGTSLVNAQTTAGIAGVSDGRQTAANIVGLLDTFLPWTLLERDVEVGVAYQCVAVQAWCLELDTTGLAYAALSNTTADALRSTKGLDILFK